MKILLVEDSKPIRHENESALHKAGYEVISAEDGNPLCSWRNFTIRI